MVDMINISARHPCLYIINTAAGIAIAVLLRWSTFLYIMVTLYSPNELQRSGNTEIKSKSVKTTNVNCFQELNIEPCSVRFYYYLQQ